MIDLMESGTETFSVDAEFSLKKLSLNSHSTTKKDGDKLSIQERRNSRKSPAPNSENLTLPHDSTDEKSEDKCTSTSSSSYSDDEDTKTLAEDIPKSPTKTRILPNSLSLSNPIEELHICITSDDDEEDSSGSFEKPNDATTVSGASAKSPMVEYNLFLNKNTNQLLSPEPATPSVTDVIFLKYHLSPRMIEEKTEAEFNFVSVAGQRNAQNSNDMTPLKYHLVTLCTIGTGTFGRVQLAKHKQTEQFYALKSMYIPSIIEKHQVDHVHHEKQILQQLDHPFIVKMFDTAKDRSNLYMIMEFLSGGELFAYLRMSKTFSSPIVKFYTAEIILALDYLHSMYIAYRDLKPENLMLTQDGHVKLTDLGFAKTIHNKSYTLCGTPAYLAPEVMERKGHNQMVDFWSLGILIFELMAGYTPFDGKDADEILDSILEYNGEVDFPRKTFSANAKDLITKLLKIEPTERLGSKSGAVEIKAHPWFENCDWDAVYNKTLRPPLIPTIHYEGDTGNFDSYEELDKLPPAKQRELDLFDEW